jgi:anti-anti-sigma factor
MWADQRGSKLGIGRTSSGCVVRVEGRGTLRESPAIQEFALHFLGQEQESGVFVIDLAGCNYLDSTFLGLLVLLHGRYNRTEPHRFLVAASDDQCERLLAPSRLNRLLDITELSPDLVVEPLEFHGHELAAHDLGRHVMECHRQLAEQGGPEQSAFQAIADRLGGELNEIEHAAGPSAQA